MSRVASERDHDGLETSQFSIFWIVYFCQLQRFFRP